MKKAFLFLILPLLLAPACGRRDKFAKQLDLGGVIEISSWPKVPQGMAGFHLYMSPEQNGEFENITTAPQGYGKIMIPHLELNKEYWFKLSYVAKDGRESKPGGAFKRKSVESNK